MSLKILSQIFPEDRLRQENLYQRIMSNRQNPAMEQPPTFLEEFQLFDWEYERALKQVAEEALKRAFLFRGRKKGDPMLPQTTVPSGHKSLTP